MVKRTMDGGDTCERERAVGGVCLCIGGGKKTGRAWVNLERAKETEGRRVLPSVERWQERKSSLDACHKANLHIKQEALPVGGGIKGREGQSSLARSTRTLELVPR